MSNNLVHEMPEEAAEPGASEVVSGYAGNDGVRICPRAIGEGPMLLLLRMFGGVDLPSA